MTTTAKMKLTPFTDYHETAGAKMVDFAGYRMPIQYTSMTAEHLAVRKNVGLFDLSHMGEFEVAGPEALDFLQLVTTNDVSALEPGQIQYSCMTYDDGGIVDDLLVYCLEPDRYLLVVNAANIEKDWAWLQSHVGDRTAKLSNRSDELGLLAIQGPNAQQLMAEVTDVDLETMAYYTHARAEVGGVEILFSRTGYTGEDGFELYIPQPACHAVWEEIAAAGLKHGLELIGLGARDTLRLEMKMALYGNDIDQTTSPIEAGLGWIVNLDKPFIGREPIARQKEAKPDRRLVCLEFTDKVFPRTGYPIVENGAAIGRITSGTVSPSLGIPIALGYVPRSLAKIGSEVTVAIRDRSVSARVVKPPFYKDGSHR